MSSRDLSDLEDGFRDRVEILLARCLDRGVKMVPYCTIRTPSEQARLWRQSRSGAEVQAKIAEFEESAPFLAGVLYGVGPQFGPQVTFAPPGLGWHQWAEAVDCYWLVDGKAEWEDKDGYRAYREIALDLGLHRGPEVDWPHIQRIEGSPHHHRSMEEINREMMERFG